MPVSADSLQLAIVKETSPGVTPATPVFDLFRTTGEDLSFSPNVSESAELGGSGRFAKPGNVTGISTSGSINFELSKFPAMDSAIAGVLAAMWGECPLTGAPGGAIDTADRITVGDTALTYTIEKRFTNPAFVDGGTLSAAAGAAGATSDITLTGAAATGTGVLVVDVAVNGGPSQQAIVDLDVGDDPTSAGDKLVLAINDLPGMTATNAAGVVTITPDSGSVDTVSSSAGADKYFYQRYKGVTFSSLSLSASPNNPVTGSLGIVGGVPELGYLPLPGATYASAGNSAVFTAPEVLDLTVGTMMGLGSSCFTDLSIEIDSANRAIQCIGVKGDKETVLGKLNATVSGTVYFSSQDILQAVIDNKTIGDSVITFSNADGDIYRFDFFDLKPTEASLSAGGSGEDLTIPLTLQPTPRAVCDDGAGNFWDSGLILSTANTAPSMPTPVGITVGALAANQSTITLSGGPATTAQTATFTYQIDGSGVDATFVANIAIGDDVAAVIAKITAAAAAAGTAGELAASGATATSVDIGIGTATSLDALSVAMS